MVSCSHAERQKPAFISAFTRQLRFIWRPPKFFCYRVRCRPPTCPRRFCMFRQLSGGFRRRPSHMYCGVVELRLYRLIFKLRGIHSHMIQISSCILRREPLRCQFNTTLYMYAQDISFLLWNFSGYILQPSCIHTYLRPEIRKAIGVKERASHPASATTIPPSPILVKRM
jgi:hypothetical protein